MLSASPVGPRHQRASSQSPDSPGLGQEGHGDPKRGILWISLLILNFQAPPCNPFCISGSGLPAKGSHNQNCASVRAGMGAVQAVETGAAPPDPPCLCVAAVLLQGQQPRGN